MGQRGGPSVILQALNDYYRRKQAEPDPKDRLPAPGLEEKEIPFVIEIGADGSLVNVGDTRSGEGKKRAAQRFLVPQGVKKTSGVAANLLWDTAEYVLGVDTRDKPQRVADQHAAFKARISALAESARQDEGIKAVWAFLEQLDLKAMEGLPEWPDIASVNPLVTFRLHGDRDLVCQRPAVVAAAVNEQDVAAAEVICLVTGERAALARLHPAIKGVWGAQTSGANIVSFNLDAFSSYGKSQGANAPVGKAAAFAYTTALNHLLAKGSRQRVQVGDASAVYWAEEPHDLETMIPDLFGEPPKDVPDRGVDALRALYKSVETGRFALGEPDDRCHVLGLAPNAARIAIRFWETGSAIELAQPLRHHFDDIRVARAPYDQEHLSLFRLLTACALQGQGDNIPPNLGGDIMRAIFQGLRYPETWLFAAVQRCRAEQRVTYPRAAALKGCLNRSIRFANRNRTNPISEFEVMLDINNPNPAYRLGRLFAALERIQEDAAGGAGKLNATIRDRYYGAASSSPVTVFTTLLRLKNHHLGKLGPGRVVQMERLIGEIMGGVDDFPRHLSLPDQGRFALGYYHQRQAFFTKAEPRANNPEETK
jgi:CRISPR-associated protein Csd1